MVESCRFHRRCIAEKRAEEHIAKLRKVGECYRDRRTKNIINIRVSGRLDLFRRRRAMGTGAKN